MIEEKLALVGEVVEGVIERRGRVGKEFVAGLAISTVVPPDGVAAWETAVAVQGSSWHPVQRYGTREEAERGHAEWVARAPELDEITDLGTPSCGEDPHTIRLRAPR